MQVAGARWGPTVGRWCGPSFRHDPVGGQGLLLDVLGGWKTAIHTGGQGSG